MQSKIVFIAGIASLVGLGFLAGIGASQLIFAPAKEHAAEVVLPNNASIENKLVSIGEVIHSLQEAVSGVERSVIALHTSVAGLSDYHDSELRERAESYDRQDYEEKPHVPEQVIIEREEATVSLEQQATFDELWYRMKDPTQNRTLTLQGLAKEIEALSPSMQRRIILESGRMVRNGELQREYFAPDKIN